MKQSRRKKKAGGLSPNPIRPRTTAHLGNISDILQGRNEETEAKGHTLHDRRLFIQNDPRSVNEILQIHSALVGPAVVSIILNNYLALTPY